MNHAQKQLLLVYLLVTIVWSTTPLAISWSNIGIGNWLSLLLRMFIGFVCCLSILALLKQKLPLDNIALKNYLTASVGIWLTMGLVYMGVSYIHSGFISVIFGLTPLFTGIFSMILLKDKPFTPPKIIGMLLAFIGLLFIYKQSYTHGELAIYGLLLVSIAMITQALVSVVLKNINTHTNALQTTTGALGFGLLPLLFLWLLLDGTVPQHITNKTILSIVYLGIFGSVIGFIGYYHIIKHLNISQVGILPLITPIFALILGFILNNELLNQTEIIGIGFIVAGLFIYQFIKKIL